MGNFKFRLSDMMPNAWFYKLKNSSQHHHPVKNKKHYLTTASTPNHQTTQPQISHPRHSYYFTREPFKPDHHPTLPNSPTNPKTSDLHFPLDPPRKSSKTTRSKRRTIRSSSKIVTSSVSAGCSCRATLESVWTNKSDSPPDYSVSSLRGSPDEMDFQESSLSPEFDSIGVEAANLSWSSSCNCRVSSSPTDIIIDIDTKRSPPTKKFEKQLDGFDSISELDLPPILTKPVKFSNNNKKKETEPSKLRRKLEEKNVHGSLSVKIVKEENIKAVKHQKTSPLIRRSSPNSPGLKLRSNSPRIASRKSHTKDMTSRIAHSLLGPKARQRTPTTRWSNSIQTSTRKTTISSTTSLSSKKMNISESFAIIKSSFDPQRDFRESMVEMIVENNIRSSRDLEDLLACYLSLNSNEYHDIIVKVFEQIWFDLTDIRL